MPFMGKDWRSPGEAWVKTETLGWQRMKIIESQLHPGCHSSPACSWPPRSEFGQHMAMHCSRGRGEQDAGGRKEFRDSLSSGSNNSSDSSRAGSQSPSPASSPEKTTTLQQQQPHTHHLHPITISSPYGQYSCCAHHFEAGLQSARINSNRITYDAQSTITRSLSRETVKISNQNSTNHFEGKPKMRYNNSVPNFNLSSSSSSSDNDDRICSDANETTSSHDWDNKLSSSKQITNKNNNLGNKPTLMKNGIKIEDDDDLLKSTDNSIINTRDDENVLGQQMINNSCCCNNSCCQTNFQNPCNLKSDSYVKTAPHCRISVRTREVAMYNTISEAFYRLDFCNAIHDIRRFNYICKLLHLLITQNLTSLSGCATKVLFTMLEQVAWEVSSNKRNIHVLKNLLNELREIIRKNYCWGRPIGSSLLWQQHFDTIERISQIVDGIELSPPKSDTARRTFNNLPVEMIREILSRLNDYRDLVNSAQASPVMRSMIDEQYLWRKLCKYHFTEQQLRFAIEHNNLFAKRGNTRGLKFSRTASADGKTSFRNPVTHKSKNNNSQATATTRQQLEQTNSRRSGRSLEVDSTSDGKTDSQSSYVTRAIKIFDKQGTSTTLGSTKIRKTGSDHLSRREKQHNAGILKSSQNTQEVNSNSNSNHSSREIDWERLFHQLRKKFDLKEEYADCLLLCRHCRCLFWKSFGHPCIKSEDSALDSQHCSNSSDLNEQRSDSAFLSASNNAGGQYGPSAGIQNNHSMAINEQEQNIQNRLSVAVLSRNFDNIAQRMNQNIGSENVSPANNYHPPSSGDNNNHLFDIDHLNANNGRERRNAGLRVINGPDSVNRERSNLNNKVKQNELVPKHVAISPQAFLKFFSL